jgi:DNA mismatch repair ATPase MutS
LKTLYSYVIGLELAELTTFPKEIIENSRKMAERLRNKKEASLLDGTMNSTINKTSKSNRSCIAHVEESRRNQKLNVSMIEENFRKDEEKNKKAQLNLTI